MTATTETQNYLLLGASGDIGSQTARQLISAGHHVFLAARPSDRLEQLAAELDSPKQDLDATDVSQVESCFRAAAESLGAIAGVVNCVGSVLLKPAHLTSDEEWHDTMATNLTSAFATVRAAGKTMAKTGGSVVLMSSAAARIGLANHEAIAAAKAGVIGLAKSAAASYAARNIRFNAVAPGLVKTKLTSKIWESDRAAAASEALHGLGRLGEPQDIAEIVCWLLQPTSGWVTGQVFTVDGGLSGVKLMARPRP